MNDSPTSILGPESYGEGAPSKFPIGRFPERIRSVATELAEVYQTPVCLAAMSVLGVLSGAIGRSIGVINAYKDKTTLLNLYVFAIAGRGIGKSVIGGTLMQPLSEYSGKIELAHQAKEAERKTALGIIQREIEELTRRVGKETGTAQAESKARLDVLHADAGKLAQEGTQERTLIVANTTSEALTRLLKQNEETLFSYSAEAGDAVKVALGKYTQKGDYDVLLSGYSGDEVRCSRVNRPSIFLRAPCLSLLWMFQGCVFDELNADKQAINRGLTARPLIFDSGAKREYDDGEIRRFLQTDAWGAVVNALLKHRFSDKPYRELNCCPEARNAFTDFHNRTLDLERDQDAHFEGELGRARENAIKVAGIFAAIQEEEQISLATANDAIAVVRWCIWSYLGIRRASERQHYQTLFEKVHALLEMRGGEMTTRDLNASNGISREELEMLCRLFPGRLVIEKRTRNGPGRPSEVLVLLQ